MEAEETMEGKSQRSSIALNSGITGVSLAEKVKKKNTYIELSNATYPGIK
jgi:hypothetical protein